jgi:NADH:ubiquinone oxidoreductase subunit H
VRAGGHTEAMDTLASVLLIVLLLIPLVIVGALFVWAARKDGAEDIALQRRLGHRRSTRLGR